MSIRLIPLALLIIGLATEATAQNRFRWRPGQIVGGIAKEIDRAFSDEITSETPEDLVKAAPITPASPTDVDSHKHRWPIQSRLNTGRADPWPLSRQRRYPTDMTERPARPSIRAVSIEDVILMVRRGLSESTIIRYVSDNGVNKPLEVSDLLRLHDEGVSEPVITAMQTARVQGIGRTTQPRLPVNESRPVNPALEFYRPSTAPARTERYGPSVLVPPQNLTLPPPPTRTLIAE